MKYQVRIVFTIDLISKIKDIKKIKFVIANPFNSISTPKGCNHVATSLS